MTGCDFDRLSQYIDGGLMLPARVELEAHMKACASCRAELQALQRIDTALSSWGNTRVPMPDEAHRRINRTVERRRRLSPVGAFARMMPAAVGTSIAALLILVSVNLGVLYQNPSVGGVASSAPITTHALAKQSATLIRVRRNSAVLGGFAAQQLHSPTIHRLQLEVN